MVTPMHASKLAGCSPPPSVTPSLRAGSKLNVTFREVGGRDAFLNIDLTLHATEHRFLFSASLPPHATIVPIPWSGTVFVRRGGVPERGYLYNTPTFKNPLPSGGGRVTIRGIPMRLQTTQPVLVPASLPETHVVECGKAGDPVVVNIYMKRMHSLFTGFVDLNANMYPYRVEKVYVVVA